jgi:polysaccharide biosynthesis protein PslH
MKILVTCDRYPVSMQDGLVLRVLHYVRRLKGHHTFDLVCLDRWPAERVDSVESMFRRVVRVPYTHRSAPTGLARLRTAFDVHDLYPQSAEARRQIDKLVASQNYDVIWDAGGNMMNCLAWARTRVPLLADQVDDSFVRLQRELALAKGAYRRLWLHKQIHLQRRFARRFLQPAAAVLFVSPLDAASFQRVCPAANVVTIANGVDENFFASHAVAPRASAADYELVFEGAMDFGPNVDAAVFMAKEILGAVRHKHPNTHLSIVGRSPVAEVRQLAGDGVEVTGFVDDVRPWLARAHVFVCPMRSGAGIKNKILQAWAMGLPVVSTPEGACGLNAKDGENILVRSSAAEFAQAVAELLADDEQRRRIGAAGRATVEREYSWVSKADELERLLAKITESGRTPS